MKSKLCIFVRVISSWKLFYQIKALRENEEVLNAAVAIAELLQIRNTSQLEFSEKDMRENENVRLAKKIWKVPV